MSEVEERASKRARMNHTHHRPGHKQKQAGKWKAQSAQSNRNTNIGASGIHNDDAGVFVTCDKGNERKCLTEVHDLFSQYLGRDGDQPVTKSTADEDGNVGADIEADIQAELDSLRPQSAEEDQLKLITLDIPCVSFVRTAKHIDPVSLVHDICAGAFAHPNQQRSRYIKRMTPMVNMRKTLGGGLEQLCEVVLKPHFHAAEPGKKFAIRPTIRNNNKLDRDTVIQTVADAVGKEHSVDLKNYDLLILVDVYRNICGMSVVGNEYERLKRYNLAEIYSPTPIPQPKMDDATEQKFVIDDAAREKVAISYRDMVTEESNESNEQNDEHQARTIEPDKPE